MLSMWKRVFLWWQWQFGWLGRLAGRRPLVLLVSAAVVAGLLCLGFLNASVADQLDRLWVPSNSRTVTDLDKFNAYFPTNPFGRLERVIVVPRNESADMLTTETLTQTFDLYSKLFNLTVVAGPDNGNLTGTRVGLPAMCAMPNRAVGCIYFNPLAYWATNLTVMRSRSQQELHDDVNQLLVSGNIPVQQHMVLGCTTKVPSSRSEGDFNVTHVGAIIFSFFMDPTRVTKETLEAWETAFLALLESSAYPDILPYGSTGVSTSQEISRQSQGDGLLLALVFVLMGVYMVLALTTFWPLCTRILLGLGAVGTVALGIAASLGFSALFFQFNPLTIQVLPFLMLSIGMDSVFILYTHFHKSIRALPTYPAPSSADLAIAMEDAMYRQGASVALTALTKAVSFVAPVAVVLVPALQEFCVIVSISVVFEVLLAFFMFNPFLVLDARREFSGRADVIPCIRVQQPKTPPPALSSCGESPDAGHFGPPAPAASEELAADAAGEQQQGAAAGGTAKQVHLSQEDGSTCFGFPPASSSSSSSSGGGGESYTAPAVETAAGSPDAAAAAAAASAAAEAGAAATEAPVALTLEWQRQQRPPRAAVETQGGFLDVSEEYERQKCTLVGGFIYRVYVPRFLARSWGQVVVFAAFGALLGLGIYGCVTLDESLELRSLVTEGTQLYNYLGYEDKCSTFIGPPMYIVTENTDYSNPGTLAHVNKLTSVIANSSYIRPPIFSWYSDFTTKFLRYTTWVNTLDPATGWPRTPELFYAALNDYLNNSIAGFAYTSDLALDRDNATRAIVGVRAARMQTFYVPLNDTADHVKAMLDLRQRLAEVPEIPAFTSSYFYVYYEQFLSIVWEYSAMLGLTISAIFLVTLLFMGLKTACVVSAMVFMIHIDMLGLSSLVGVNLNAVSAVNAVAIMGLADEYVNYIMRAFELEEGRPQERMQSALLQYIRPVSNAAMSTILGIIPLAFAKSAAYKVYYFRMFFIATVLSWLTGIVFLPAFLLATHGEGLGAPLKRFLRRIWKKKEKREVSGSEQDTVDIAVVESQTGHEIAGDTDGSLKRSLREAVDCVPES